MGYTEAVHGWKTEEVCRSETRRKNVRVEEHRRKLQEWDTEEECIGSKQAVR